MDKIKIFKALSNDSRVKIINLLDNNNLCACKIIENLNLTQSTISHHMKILEDAKLINSIKVGKWRHYSINSVTFKELEIYFSRIEENKFIIEGCNCD
ncbi:MAG: metalloregulator ArsR/SmtB family transcription factor [Bacillota bacterium]|nr:metalloregulator ArsR/SmtB family transcription factor [Bacillota bacterium]